MRFTAVFPLALLAAAMACGGARPGVASDPDAGGAPDAGQPATSFVAWPITGATVTAFHANPATLAADVQLGTATTTIDGSFSLTLQKAVADPVLVIVTGGSYTEPATGTPILMTGHQLTALLPARQLNAGATLDGVMVSPVSHLIAQLALHLVAQGVKGADAFTTASTLLNKHFGALDWSSVRPTDLTDPNGKTVQLNDQTKAGLILAGLSQEARTLAEARGFTAGAALNSLSLLEGIAHDIGDDGYFDGKGTAGQITVPASTANAYPLDGQSVRATLSQGILAFLANSRNASKLSSADVQPLVAALAGDKEPQLFRDGGGPVNVTPPTIAWIQPSNASTVRGSTTVEVTATAAAGKVSSFTFTAPSALTNVVASPENGGTVRRLKATLDVSSTPDGALPISVTATDDAGNVAGSTLTVTVANHGPSLVVTSPSASATVKGTVTIVASAAPQQTGTTIRSLVLLNPPPGAGPNTLPAADSLNIVWDTTKTLEGAYVLQLQATDSAGGQTTVLVPVLVDNVPFGVVTALVSAGAPIAGAAVTVVAIDPATGATNTSIGPNAGVLGSGSGSDSSGRFVLTLSVENYSGPIQVRVSGTGLSYVDTSDGTTQIHLPEDVQLTSFIANYTTGQAITVPVTLWTTLADREALAYASGKHRTSSAQHPLAAALAFGDPLFEAHLTPTPWNLRSVVPAALTVGQNNLSDVVFAATADVGLNQLARDLSAHANITPGTSITAITLLELLESDLDADGQFDGLGAGGAQLATPGSPAQNLDANTLRFSLATALNEFFQGAQNKTGITSQDLRNSGVLSTVAGDASQLFGSQTPLTFNPPVVSFTAPSSGSGVHGSSVQVQATASSSYLLSSFAFTAPASLASIAAQFAADHTSATLTATWNVSALPDGDTMISVIATDQYGSSSPATITVHVANHGPSISIASPGDGSTVKGTLNISATASPHAGAVVTKLNVTSIALLGGSPAEVMPGLGADQLPAADQFLATWDSTKAWEGRTAITLHAEDNYGAATDSTIAVNVDNVPFGVLNLALSFGGQPIPDATVHVYAVRDADGQVDSTIGASGEMGPPCTTDRSGLCTITLSTENRVGPIQLVAGGSGLSFIDPADGVTSITIPQSFQFTSFIGHYATGATISAPITEYTTLADAAAMAYASGRNRLYPVPHSLTTSLAFSDPLFNKHITATAWDLRSSLPVSLTNGTTQTLAVAYPSLPGIGLSQLARQLGAAAGTSVSGFNGLSLVQLAIADLAADGQLDGLGAGGARLTTPGTQPQSLDTNTLRYLLALAIDSWLSTPANRSGIVETTFLGSDMPNTISNDASALFGSSPAPLPFDNQPPVVAFSSTTFHGSDELDHAPYGGTYVAGRLNLVVNASDSPAGVRSVSVAVNGSSIAAGSGSSLPTKFVASVDTTTMTDGPLTVSVIAVDNYGNTGTTTITYRVDNTPPTESVTAPADQSPTNGGVSIAASASDTGAGLASFVVNGLAGFLDTDTSVAGIAGTWSSTSTPEGPVVATFKACDLVGNCSSVNRTIIVDRTPPAVAVSSPTTTVYQFSPSITITAAATDALTGVAKVVARVLTTNGPEIVGQPNGSGGWSINVTGLRSNFANSIAVYAYDAAGNSGSGSSSLGAQQLVNVTVDQLQPSPALLVGFTTYCDETGLRAAVDGSGHVVMPPQYSCVQPTLVSVDTSGSLNATPVYKTATRLSWGASPPSADQTAAGTTGLNIPAIVFSIPYSAPNESPIASASFTATITAGNGTTNASGSLRPRSDGQSWVLPITSDVLPPLASVPDVAQVKVYVSATDYAGNTYSPGAIATATFRFALVAPPVAVYEDTSFGAANPTADAHYTLSGQSYATLFQPYQPGGPFAPEGPRLARYVFENPAPITVGAALSLVQGDGSHPTGFAARENWTTYFPGAPYGSESFSEQSGINQCPGLRTDPGCGSDVLFANNPNGDYVCAPLPTNGSSVVETPASSSVLFAGYAMSGGSETAAQSTSSGGLVVPPANGSTPGRLVVYLARPPNLARTSYWYEALSWDSITNRYENYEGKFLTNLSRNICYSDPDNQIYLFEDDYQMQDFSTYLASASTVVAGTWSASAVSLAPASTTVVGANRQIVAGQSFTRTISH